MCRLWIYSNLGRMRANIEIYNEDCLTAMKAMPDKFYDLAIVDPPYGIGEDGAKNHSRSKAAKAKQYTPKNWDAEAPQQEYFNELMRVSKNQIIWGANHFIERINKNSSCWIVWDKMNGDNDFADGELAYTSFNRALRRVKINRGQLVAEGGTIHPTQKPVKLYDWIFHNYAKPTDSILDTNLGSQSSRIAAHKHSLEFIGCELDSDYFYQGCKRFDNHVRQLTIF
jgi:site-specific DNA-methyltransferase (adenine-specific)